MATLRYYDALEAATIELDRMNADALVTKQNIAESMRQRLLQLMRHVLVTPMIGEEYAYPGDIDLRPWYSPKATSLRAPSALAYGAWRLGFNRKLNFWVQDGPPRARSRRARRSVILWRYLRGVILDAPEEA